ncbi:MAG: SRPBCC family protein [Acidimicrobiales bacterium]
MPRYRTSVRSPWTARQAFDYLSDLEHFADWDPGVKRSVRVAGKGAAIGSAFDVTVGGVGRDLTLRYEIVAIDAPKRVEVRAETGTLRSIDVMTFEPASDGGCTVTYDAQLSLKGLLVVGNPVLGLVFGRIGDRAAAGLRRELGERHSAGPAPAA